MAYDLASEVHIRAVVLTESSSSSILVATRGKVIGYVVICIVVMDTKFAKSEDLGI